MFGRRYFGRRAFGPRYWGDGGVGVACLYDPFGERVRYGTDRTYGTCWKYGDGRHAPWIPLDGAERFDVESLFDPNADAIRDHGTLLQADFQGGVTARYGSYPNEVFYMTSPNGTSWRITVDGTTGAITVQDGISGTPAAPLLVDQAGVSWRLSIGNDGGLSASNGPLSLTIETSIVPTYTVEDP